MYDKEKNVDCVLSWQDIEVSLTEQPGRAWHHCGSKARLGYGLLTSIICRLFKETNAAFSERIQPHPLPTPFLEIFTTKCGNLLAAYLVQTLFENGSRHICFYPLESAWLPGDIAHVTNNLYKQRGFVQQNGFKQQNQTR